MIIRDIQDIRVPKYRTEQFLNTGQNSSEMIIREIQDRTVPN
jgi:hypothetical protein